MAEFKLLYGIPNYSICKIYICSHYFPILHGCMNTCMIKEIFKGDPILFEGGCSSMIVMRMIIK